MICPKCQTFNDEGHMFCKNCGTALIGEKQLKSPLKQTKLLGIDSRLVAVAFGILLLATIILGVFSVNTHNQLNTTQIKLSKMQSQLTTAQNQLSITQNQLAVAESQLTAVQDQLTNAQNEITQLTDTDNGPVVPAKTVLDQFLSDAKASNYPAMWAMLSPDCQALYSNESDFESNNSVAQKNGYYLLSSYYIGSASILPSWQNYSNVPEIQVVLVANENPTANIVSTILSDIIPGLGLIDGMVPTTTVTSWEAHLIQVGNNWEIYCERASGTAPSNSNSITITTNPSTTQSTTSTTQLSGVPTVTAQDLVSEFNAGGIIGLKYTGEIINVTGVINAVTATSLTLVGTSSEGVTCNFSSANVSQLAGLSTGQTVTIQGKCTGSLVGPSLDGCGVIH
jgi:hypothetical protein